MKGVDQIEHTLHNLASPKRGHTFWGLLLVFLLAFILIWLKHGEWLKSPNDFMLTNSPDGFKNYMTSAWHVQHDSSYVHYSGMNFPFGEHVLFTDNQPIVSASMQWWSRHVFDVRNNVVGVINVLQVLSIIFGAGIIYLLLRKLHLPVWYAGWAALAIAFLSPQYNRFDGHFGLSHIWVLPMLLLILCRYEERQSRRYQSLLIGILIWFSAQLHFYNLGVSALFLGFYTFFQILLNPSWRNIWTRLSHLTVMVLLPFALLNVWLHWSDYCPDRPANPYGFTDYIAHWEGIFLPYDYFPMHHWIDRYITKIRDMDFEAQSYVGLAAFLFTLWLLFKRRFRLFETEWEHAAYHRVHKNYLRGICFAAFAILLFGLGFPFSIKGLEWMADYLGPLRQFRGLGRFTWAFYYSINLLLFYIAWNKSIRFVVHEKWIARTKVYSIPASKYMTQMARWSIALVPLFLLSWEALFFQQHKPIQPGPNLTKKNVVATSPNHWLNKVDFSRFQALMPLPYYHIGSENIWLDMYYPLFQKEQFTALLTGVPDMGVNMSRSAISRMVKSMQFSLTACESPALLSEFPDNRPIALMIEPAKWEEVKIKYDHLISKATPVYQGPDLNIMALIPDSVRTWSEQQAEKVLSEMNKEASVTLEGGLKSNNGSLFFVQKNFDSMAGSPFVFKGKGAIQANLGDTTWIWNNKLPRGQYFFSIWIKVDQDMGMTQDVHFLETSPADGHQISFKKETLRSEIKTIVDGWALFELPFEVKEEQSTFSIFLNKRNVSTSFSMDEVMIRAANLNVYKREPGWVMRNNYWHKRIQN